jgi:hypothetical protein
MYEREGDLPSCGRQSICLVEGTLYVSIFSLTKTSAVIMIEMSLQHYRSERRKSRRTQGIHSL